MAIHVVERFRQWLVEDGKAEVMIQSYDNDVCKFNQYLVEKDCDPKVLLSRFYFTSYIKRKGGKYRQIPFAKRCP